jgi:RNA polymerase sigma factor for flagellar operon FliA
MTAADKHAANNMPMNTLDRDQVIEDMLIHVRYIARRIHERLPQHIVFEDLVQSGIVGLIDAVHKYDPTKNTQFKTYAKFRIRGAILDSLRECDWAPRDLRRQARRIEKIQSKLRNELGHAPTEEETAQALDLDLKQYHELLGTLNGLTLGSLDSTSGHEGAQDELATYLPYAPDQDPFFLCAQSEMKDNLRAALEELPKNERDVLVLYYYEELTLKEVGAVVGVVESRACQLRAAALLRLRSRMQDGPTTPCGHERLRLCQTDHRATGPRGDRPA